MVIDTSAIVAILGMEPESARLAQAIEADPNRLISAATVVETGLVVESRYSIESVSVDHADIAREAWRRFGKGRHSANLNFGDCFSYALAKGTGEPLLFKGDDFTLTDIGIVRY
jgi:ribonuclease VapC